MSGDFSFKTYSQLMSGMFASVGPMAWWYALKRSPLRTGLVFGKGSSWNSGGCNKNHQHHDLGKFRKGKSHRGTCSSP